MPRKKHTDVLDKLSKFQKTVLSKKPSMEQMFEDIRMMRFKIRSLQGDISVLNIHNLNFIEALWSLGKLDEFFQNHIETLSASDRDTVFPLLEEMYSKFQNELNKVNSKHEQVNEMTSGFEMEIFKDQPKRHN